MWPLRGLGIIREESPRWAPNAHWASQVHRFVNKRRHGDHGFIWGHDPPKRVLGYDCLIALT